MNYKKLAAVFLAVFVTIFISDFIIHGVILKSTYQATQNLWRPESEMTGFMPFMLMGQASAALFFSWIFMHGYKGKGPIEGIRYGLLIGGFIAGHNLVMYSVAPYEFGMVAAWISLGAVQAVLAGIVCSLICGKRKGVS